MKYIHVGSEYLDSSLFQKIGNPKENTSLKPTGGLWLSEYHDNYCVWIDYLLNNKSTFYYKYGLNNSIPSIIISLKQSARIYYIRNMQDLEFLFLYYPSRTCYFDYQSLSEDYDGICIDPFNFWNNADPNIKKAMFKISIKSLILFNLECIENHEKTFVHLNLNTEDYTDYYIERPDTILTNDENRLVRNFVHKND